MKKLFSLILVLGLLLGGNAYTKEVFLHCKNYKVIGHYKYGDRTSNEPGTVELDQTFKINSANKIISSMSIISGKFYDIKDAKWSEARISWGTKFIDEEINRIDLSYKSTSYLVDHPLFKRIQTFGKCSIVKKAI